MRIYKYVLSIFLIPVFLVLLSSCKPSQAILNSTASDSLSASLSTYLTSSPVNLNEIKASFYKGIKSGEASDNLFDIFIPSSGKPSSLVLYIHGGGFIGGDKTIAYQGEGNAKMIRNCLSKNIAFASINYRLLKPKNNEGVLMCLNDSKRALQYIRYHSKSLNIDKSKVILMGGSAGAGTSLWLAFNDDMAEKNSPDFISRESTRVKGVVAFNPQATYDLSLWIPVVFNSFLSKGFNETALEKIAKKDKIADFYGLDLGETIFTSAAFKSYAKKVDMLALMSADDPEIYIEMGSIKNQVPVSAVEINHHPLQGKALMEQAEKKNLKAKFSIPELDINTTGGEKKDEFVFRLIGDK